MNQLIHGDCLVELPKIAEHSIDFIFTDLPYGTTQNKWDSIIPLGPLWKEWWRVLKPNGAIALTSAQPFTSMLVSSQLKYFKYEVIWVKTIGAGQLNIKHQPLRMHESVLLFYKKRPTYNEQKSAGKPYKINRKLKAKGPGYGKQTNSAKINEGFRHAKSIIEIPNPRVKNGHPTQKPIALPRYFIETFTNPGDIVLDSCAGSGSTLIAAIEKGRSYIGIEKDKTYFSKMKEDGL